MKKKSDSPDKTNKNQMHAQNVCMCTHRHANHFSVLTHTQMCAGAHTDARTTSVFNFHLCEIFIL